MRKSKIRNLFVSAAIIAGSASPAYATGKPVIKKSNSKNKKIKKKVIQKNKSKKKAKKITLNSLEQFLTTLISRWINISNYVVNITVN